MSRLPAVVILFVLALVSLPISASFLDGERTEDIVLPVHFLVMAVAGAVIAQLLPLANAGASATRRTVIGVATGLGMAVLGMAVFWFLLNGLGGA
ncbi:hypothetical protein IEU95_09125 [Hoyosella rhizosphaerae]|uniref:Uncharacterized protein n=1 Tax=Hoyosella rhizosphaerae TaxID=1755582 RepID=A0A916X8K1_9ACTN|nr:hypothetical protein [Hoyosella rhizosphaerae]MBN4926993.1 hypothetical protein [Hoyosella rhizosphaerae]GGC54899.1 hypothetical protein GCM10011410_04090 [Hoyosella rhizosphaerae]